MCKLLSSSFEAIFQGCLTLYIIPLITSSVVANVMRKESLHQAVVISDLPMALVWVCRRWLPFPSERRTVVSGWSHSCVVPLAHIACAHLDHTLYMCVCVCVGGGDKDHMHTKEIYSSLISSPPLNTLFLSLLPPAFPSLYPSLTPSLHIPSHLRPCLNRPYRREPQWLQNVGLL